MGTNAAPVADLAMISTIEDNLEAWIPILGLVGRTSTSEPPGVQRVISAARSSLFNSIMHTRLNEEDVEATIQYLMQDARQRKAPILWWVSPSTQPADIGTRLLAHGFKLDDDGPGMAVNLLQLNEQRPQLAGLSIRIASGDEQLWQWCRAMADGFEIPPQLDFIIPAWHDFLAKTELETVVPFLAWLDGKPVATSLLFLAAGAAGIYAVSTLPEARRKGIGGWVTLRALQHGRERGYTVGTLQASAMGEPVYRKLGFEAYCHITSYVFRPDGSLD